MFGKITSIITGKGRDVAESKSAEEEAALEQEMFEGGVYCRPEDNLPIDENMLEGPDENGDYKVLFYSKDLQSLEYYSEIYKSNCQAKGFVLQEEDLITTSVFMYAAPMKYDEIYRKFSKRFQTIFRSNVASITPLGTDSRGFGQDPVIQLFGRNGQAQSFDLYDRNAPNKNAVIIAPSGRGKSFFTQRKNIVVLAVVVVALIGIVAKLLLG